MLLRDVASCETARTKGICKDASNLTGSTSIRSSVRVWKRFKMQLLGFPIALIASLPMIAYGTEAESKTMQVTVSYHRNALRFHRMLNSKFNCLMCLDGGSATRRIASQRFVMPAVPMSVTLTYDEHLIDAQASYAVVALIWSGGNQIFRATRRLDPLDGSGSAEADITLSMVSSDEEVSAPPRTIAGIQWAVTEVSGVAWANDDPATLIIDDEMNFSIFGGCNRFNGQLTLSDGEVSFPENFAGTLMACPDEIEALERSFLNALTRVSGYVRYGAGLVMTDPLGNAVLHFDERPE